MTVAELIATLQGFDPNAPVVVWGGDDAIHDVGKVEASDCWVTQEFGSNWYEPHPGNGYTPVRVVIIS